MCPGLPLRPCREFTGTLLVDNWKPFSVVLKMSVTIKGLFCQKFSILGITAWDLIVKDFLQRIPLLGGHFFFFYKGPSGGLQFLTTRFPFMSILGLWCCCPNMFPEVAVGWGHKYGHDRHYNTVYFWLSPQPICGSCSLLKFSL